MSFSRWFALVLVGWLLVPALDVAAQPSHPDDEITKLADDVYLFRHQFHQAIFLTTPEGVIVTDPISAEAATWLRAEIAKLTDKPVRYVVYSPVRWRIRCEPVVRLICHPMRRRAERTR